ncbi:hypothetical protein KIL84_004433 [Mauremys mutica]|uniref:Uncharacterized protein n=1 Tax=Mauremys mutica TaxID=74926 RepID=A0A9D4B6X9_9SAUR|nr:hypothetical protein KIL84_004433 [Mauremys mutica]
MHPLSDKPSERGTRRNSIQSNTMACAEHCCASSLPIIPHKASHTTERCPEEICSIQCKKHSQEKLPNLALMATASLKRVCIEGSVDCSYGIHQLHPAAWVKETGREGPEFLWKIIAQVGQAGRGPATFVKQDR